MKHTDRQLQEFALHIRVAIVHAIAHKGGGHIGGSLDLAELLAVLYGEELRIRPGEPDWKGRDYLVCSKGHAGPAVYAALALKGFFPYEWLETLNQEGTSLPGHCDRSKVPGIDATTGSLGQGLSISCGLALGAKLSKTEQRAYCILGDGELAEGQNWEAAQFASHYQLDNLTAFLDWNKMQIDGTNDSVMKLGDVAGKFTSFGWHTALVDGSNISEIYRAIEGVRKISDRPSIIVLDTVKGANLSCISSLSNNHCIGMTKDLTERAMAELRDQAAALGMEAVRWA